jgi:hypothetical protein
MPGNIWNDILTCEHINDELTSYNVVIFKINFRSQDRSVGTATNYRLDGPGIAVRFLAKSFLHSIQTDTEGHLDSMKWVTEALTLGV